VYPDGHFGADPLTFLVNFPLTQVIALTTGAGFLDGVGAGEVGLVLAAVELPF
jgi:hypothetical protein